MTDDSILELLQPVEERASDKLQVFIPEHLAARCADCGGIFLRTAGKCPGCGSLQYVLDSKVQPLGGVQ